MLDALTWVSLNLGIVGDTARMFVLGHSPGGVYGAGLLLSPPLFARSPPIRGVILLGVPFEIPAATKTAVNIRRAAEMYYGDGKRIAANQPLGMLRRAEKEFVVALPPLRNMTGVGASIHRQCSENIWAALRQ